MPDSTTQSSVSTPSSTASCGEISTWAAAPRAPAARFGAASVASAAAAIGLGECRSRAGRDLDSVGLAALAAELAATLAAEHRDRRAGVSPVLESLPSVADQVGAIGLGTLVPLGPQPAALLLTRHHSPLLSGAASVAILAGSLTMRVSVMAAGNRSASNAEVSLRFGGRDQGG